MAEIPEDKDSRNTSQNENSQDTKKKAKEEERKELVKQGIIGVVTGQMLCPSAGKKVIVGATGVDGYQDIKKAAYYKNRERLKCFIADTWILTKTGYCPIQKIKKGVSVYSKNAQTGENGLQKVEAISLSDAHTIYEIWLDGKDKISTTAYHPISVPGKGWVSVIQLKDGNLVETMEGTAKITKIRKVRYEEPVEVYNLQVAGWASFFVSERQVYVHNCAVEQGLCKRARDGYERIIEFREKNQISGYDKASKNTVAHIRVGDTDYFGVNSNLMVDELKEKVLERNRTLFQEIEWVPPRSKPPKHAGHTQSLTHAEATALLQLSGNCNPMPKKITMTVDRTTCGWCRKELPVLMRHLGIEELEIFSGDLNDPSEEKRNIVNPLILKAADPLPK